MFLKSFPERACAGNASLHGSKPSSFLKCNPMSWVLSDADVETRIQRWCSGCTLAPHNVDKNSTFARLYSLKQPGEPVMSQLNIAAT